MAHSLRRTLAATLVTAAAAAAPLAAQGQPAAPAVTIGGVVYTQFAAELDSGTNSNFDVKRAYLNVIGRFSDGIMTRVTGDVYQNADGSHTYRLKYAFVNWTPAGSALTYRFGLITTPWLDWEEALWDYRMQGPMALDRAGKLSAGDFGAGVDGSISSEAVNFQAAVFDGTNYSGKPGDMHKAFAGRLSVRLLGTDDASRIGGLRLTGYAQLGSPTGGGTLNRFVGELSYRTKNLLLAGEYAATGDSVPASTSVVKGSVWSVYGFYHLPASPVAVIARLDKTNLNTANDVTSTDIIAGVSYQLTSNVRLLADVDALSFQNSPEAKVTQGLFQLQFTF